MLEVIEELHTGRCDWCGKYYWRNKVFSVQETRTNKISWICVYCLKENFSENL